MRSNRLLTLMAFVSSVLAVGCDDDCANGDACPSDRVCVYDYAQESPSRAVCVAHCYRDDDCPTEQTCTGRGDDATSDLLLVITFCRTPLALTPHEGRWHYNKVTPFSTTCPSNVQGEYGDFAIDQASSTSFRIVSDNGTDPSPCSVDETKFDCFSRAAKIDDFRPIVDAVVTVYPKNAGEFTADAKHASGRQEGYVDCVGTQCNTFDSTFPCNFIVSFKINAL